MSWFAQKKKKEEAPVTEAPKEEITKEEIVSIKYSALMEIIMVNNKTDKEYIFKSENNFGLKYTFIDDNKNRRNDLCCIQQLNSIDEKTGWQGVARLYDYSIVKMVHQTFELKKEEKENEQQDNSKGNLC